MELCGSLGNAAVRRRGMTCGPCLGPVEDGDTGDDLGQLVLAFQAPPSLRGSRHQLEDHQPCPWSARVPPWCAPFGAERWQRHSRWGSRFAGGPSARRGSRRRPAEPRGPWSGRRPPWGTSLRISRRKTAMAASAAARAGAPWTSRRSSFIAAWTDFRTLLSTLAVLCTQQR